MIKKALGWSMDRHFPIFLEKNIFFRKLFLLRKLVFTKKVRPFYSQFGEDIAIGNFLNIKNKGFYVDVGCYHPIKYNNTYKLYKKGWEGINIDLDAIKIEAFNFIRPRDHNITAVVSDISHSVDIYSFGFYSLLSTIDKASADRYQGEGGKVLVRKVKTRSLTDIIEN